MVHDLHLSILSLIRGYAEAAALHGLCMDNNWRSLVILHCPNGAVILVHKSFNHFTLCTMIATELFIEAGHSEQQVFGI